MKTHAVVEETPAGNFTILAECNGAAEAEAFVKGQKGRALIIQTAGEAYPVISRDGLTVEVRK